MDAIFYPCLTYNFDEHAADNHYNCPVVAYYSELLSGNMDEPRRACTSSIRILNINADKDAYRRTSMPRCSPQRLAVYRRARGAAAR